MNNFLIFFIIIFIIILIIYTSKNNNEIIIKDDNNKPIKIFNYNNKDDLHNVINANYYKIGNEEELKQIYPGYANELMYENNLKDGEYKNQFDINISQVPTDNQICFNPIVRDKSLTLPLANINIKVL